MSDELIAVSPDWAKRAWVDDAKYKEMYDASVKDPVKFWGEHGKRVDWIKPYSPGAVRDVDYNGQVRIRWFHDGVLNVSANCIDRHLSTWRKNKAAIIWEGEPGEIRTLTYQQMHGSADCAFDCGGHEAGYAWAKASQIEDASMCAARGPSFNRGCRAYTEDLAQRTDALLRAQ